jgi:hypothetical protein
VQGYNAQAVMTCQQVIVAAELTQDANDLQQLDPMLKATSTTVAAAGIQERPDTLLADSGYWSIADLTTIPDAPELYIPPGRHARQGKPSKDSKPSASKSDGLRAAMNAKLTRENGKGPLRQAEGVRRASLRRDQGRPWCPPAAAPRPPGVRGGVEAAVRHPQPAEAVAPHPPPAGTHADRRLSRGEQRPHRTHSWLRQLFGRDDASDREPISGPSGWLRHRDESFQQRAGQRQELDSVDYRGDDAVTVVGGTEAMPARPFQLRGS